jgi:ATP-dependent DNA ligase
MARGYRESGEGIQTAGKKADGGATAMRSKHSRQAVLASKPPSGPDWVHEIKHDGSRLIVRRDGPTVRFYTRDAYYWTGLSRFEDLRRREAAWTAILYAFDLIEHDGVDLRERRLSIARLRWRDCCAVSRPAFCSTNTSPTMRLLSLRTLAGLRRGHRLQEGRSHLSNRSMLGLG